MSDPWSATMAVVEALDAAGIPNAIGAEDPGRAQLARVFAAWP